MPPLPIRDTYYYEVVLKPSTPSWETLILDNVKASFHLNVSSRFEKLRPENSISKISFSPSGLLKFVCENPRFLGFLHRYAKASSQGLSIELIGKKKPLKLTAALNTAKKSISSWQRNTTTQKNTQISLIK